MTSALIRRTRGAAVLAYGIATLCTVVPIAAGAQSASPYTGQQHREIKALSADEVRDYLEGRGMGLARAAELNGYPGPMHVLELSGPLELSPDQVAKTEALFAAMKAQAVDAGKALVTAERELDTLFREQRIDPRALAKALDRVGAHQVEVRRIHLDAHLAQAAILTPHQIRRYAELRGYTDSAAPPHDAGRHGHGRGH